jgi:APA family basic amino acid/polyamine antiporter
MHESALSDRLRSASSPLPRVLGFRDTFNLLVGTVIGSGIFIVPATIAGAVESPVLMLAVWVVGGILTFFGALAFAELAAAYPDAGGMYVYLREAYGRLVAFLFGWSLFFVIDAGSVAALASALSTKYLPHFVPLGPLGAKLVSVTLIAAIVIINCAGVRWGALVQGTLTFIKVAGVVGLSVVVFLFADGNPAHFTSPPAPPLSPALLGGFGVALVASLWAYKGWEVATFAAGEVQHPQRNLPRALLAGTLVIVALYLLANVAYLYVFRSTDIAGSSRIAADAMNAAVGPVGASIIAAVILLSIIGATNGTILAAARVFFAMARDGLFFERAASVHPQFLTPHVSLIVFGTWCAILSLSGTFEQLLTYAVFGQWIFFGLTVGAVFVLRLSRPELPRPYRTWGYPVTPILFIAATLFIAVNALITQFWEAIAGLALILLGIPAAWYWMSGRRSAVRREEPARSAER